MTQQKQDVVGMSYFSGSMGGTLRSTLHVCIDHLADGSLVQTLYTGASMAQPVLRSALCVRGTLTLAGQDCTPSEYIAAWRATQAAQPRATLQAWFDTYLTTTTMVLPAAGAAHAHWLSPVYRQASERLFGDKPHGVCSAEIRSVDDIHDAVAVQHGRAAFGLAEQALNATLSIRRRAIQMKQLALAA